MSARGNPEPGGTVKTAERASLSVREELEAELTLWRTLYDRFGAAHIRHMAENGISPWEKRQG